MNIQQRKLRISGQNGRNKNSDINGCHKWNSLCSRVLKNRMMWKTKHLNTFSLENLTYWCNFVSLIVALGFQAIQIWFPSPKHTQSQFQGRYFWPQAVAQRRTYRHIYVQTIRHADKIFPKKGEIVFLRTELAYIELNGSQCYIIRYRHRYVQYIR